MDVSSCLLKSSFVTRIGITQFLYQGQDLHCSIAWASSKTSLICILSQSTKLSYYDPCSPFPSYELWVSTAGLLPLFVSGVPLSGTRTECDNLSSVHPEMKGQGWFVT